MLRMVNPDSDRGVGAVTCLKTASKDLRDLELAIENVLLEGSDLIAHGLHRTTPFLAERIAIYASSD